MKKLIATAAAAAALVLVVSSPAMAQVTSEVEGEDNDTFTAQYVDASQVVAFAQVQYNANEDLEDDVTVDSTNDLSVTVNQANAGLGEIDDLDQGGADAGDFSFFVN